MYGLHKLAPVSAQPFMLVLFCLLFSLTAKADDIYKWATANGTRFYLKVRDPAMRTAQIQENSESNYSGDIVIPEKMTTDDGIEYTITLIDQQAFQGNSKVTSVSIPRTVTEIGHYSFSGCTAMKSVTLGNGVTQVFKDAFANCSSLETITFPISNLWFENETFTGCNNVKEVYLEDTHVQGVQGTDPFELIGSQATLFVPYGTEEGYKTQYGWKDFTVKPFLVLDENKTFTLDKKIEDIRTIFKRSIKSGKWNSFCIPFNLSATDIATVFGTGTRILEFDPNSTELTLNFVDVQSITANKPCLIKPTTSWNVHTFNSLTIDPSTALTVSGINYNFTGNYSNGNVPIGAYFIASNKFYKSVDGSDLLKGYRAYIRPAYGANGAKMMLFSINESTGIDGLNGTSQDSAYSVYTIDGRLIYKNLKKPSDLPKGLYIVNGKKILIK